MSSWSASVTNARATRRRLPPGAASSTPTTAPTNICAESLGVQFSIGFQQRLGAGVFGGTGFRLQKLTGQGQSWVALNGEVVVYDLQPGNTLRVHPSQVGMFQESVQFNVVTVPGIQNMFFGGSGLFLAALTGPGRVWLQSMSMHHLAHAIQEYLPKAG